MFVVAVSSQKVILSRIIIIEHFFFDLLYPHQLEFTIIFVMLNLTRFVRISILLLYILKILINICFKNTNTLTLFM